MSESPVKRQQPYQHSCLMINDAQMQFCILSEKKRRSDILLPVPIVRTISDLHYTRLARQIQAVSKKSSYKTLPAGPMRLTLCAFLYMIIFTGKLFMPAPLVTPGRQWQYFI